MAECLSKRSGRLVFFVHKHRPSRFRRQQSWGTTHLPSFAIIFFRKFLFLEGHFNSFMFLLFFFFEVSTIEVLMPLPSSWRCVPPGFWDQVWDSRTVSWCQKTDWEDFVTCWNKYERSTKKTMCKVTFQKFAVQNLHKFQCLVPSRLCLKTHK